jgi:hypothetical protein
VITLKKMLNFIILGLLVMGMVAISGCADKAAEQTEETIAETVNETADQAVNATEQAVMNVTETVPAIVGEAEETVAETVNETTEAVNETISE